MNADYFAGRSYDLCFFRLPIWICWVIAFLIPQSLYQLELPLWLWLLLILAIDVSHVWSTLYRTYLDPVTRDNQAAMLILVPPACFLICYLLALHSDQLFWRVLAYLATYHFIKQQWGFVALYRTAYQQRTAQLKGNTPAQQKRLARLDNWAIYVATLCPLLWWHAHLPRHFSWFVEGDYLRIATLVQALPASVSRVVALLFYAFWAGILAYWIVAHLLEARKHHLPLPTGRLLWIMGTAINWYLGLVYFNSELIFTLTNVVAHGVPYLGLMALHQGRKHRAQNPQAKHQTSIRLMVMLQMVLLLAFCEEYLWDFLIYRDRPDFFTRFLDYGRETVDTNPWRAFWIAILSLPQTTHYIFDRYIWKMDGRNPDLKPLLYSQ